MKILIRDLNGHVDKKKPVVDITGYIVMDIELEMTDMVCLFCNVLWSYYRRMCSKERQTFHIF